MPGGDGTGPLGIGPRTGRAAGFCAGYDVPGAMNPTLGGVRGAGFGGHGQAGGGRGWQAGRGRNWDRNWGWGATWGRRWRNYPPMEVPEESGPQPVNLKVLERQLEVLDSEIAEIRQLLHAGEGTETGDQ